MPTVLLATLGGSPEPVITAILSRRPDYVCLVCTPRDPASGRPGSETQVAEVVRCSGLMLSQVSTLLVPSDDLDGAFSGIRAKLADIRREHAGAEVTADYTGGTKSMVGALILAALDAGDVALQVVTGTRADLVSVRDGTQAVSPANDEALRLEWGMRPLLTAWRRYAYDEAAAGLGGLFRPRNPELSARLNRARDLSTAFAAWDRFDHPEALQLMEIYAPALGQVLSPYIGVLKALTSADSAKRSAFQILDLWRNAERRAVQGRYDDAIARGYRLTEWAAQWILQRRAGIDTADVDPARIPAGMMLSPSRTGKRQAGLYAAWQMVDALTDGPGAQFFRAQGKELLDHLHSRNSSILAHGFTPLGREQWSSFATWLEQHLLLAFIAEAGPSIVRSMPPQLPDRCPHG